MAVGRKKSRSKIGHRRGGNTKVTKLQLGVDEKTGETNILHFVSASGTYRGKKVLKDID